MRFQALTEHQLLVLWVQLLVLVLAARGLGGLMRRLGQPSVIGELAAGVLLGPSALGRLAPGVWEWLFPADPVHAGLMNGIAWLGVFFLLVLAGFETDLGLVRRLGRAAFWVSCGSLLLPLLAGLATGFVLPEAFLGRAENRTTFAAFMATALAISSLPVVAKLLTELNLMRRNFAQLTLAAGMANDVVGWVLLGVIARLAQSGDVEFADVAVSLGGLVVLVVFAFTWGQRLIDAQLRWLRQRHGGQTGTLTVIVLAALAGAAATQAVGLEGVLGAFIVGIVLGRSKFQESEAFATLEAVTLSFFAPFFFARAGLRVDLTLLADPAVLFWSGVVLAAASASKICGAYAGARLAGLESREGLALGAGLNARGAVEIVVASVGLSIGVLSISSYTAVVLMAIATSMMVPVLLRLALHGWEGSAEERERLERERALDRNVLVRPMRVLLPTRGGANSILAARIVDLAWPEGMEATVLSVGDEPANGDIARVMEVFEARPVEHEHVAGRVPLEVILEQARLGFGAIGMGATDRRQGSRLVSELVDDLLANSPLPVIMVRRASVNGDELVFRRILVPAEGTAAGRAAQEVGFSVARRLDADVVLAHVVTAPRSPVLSQLLPWRRVERSGAEQERVAVAERVVEEARAFAEEMGVRAATFVRTGVSAAEELLTLAREADADLVVVAANVRQVSGRPFLGHGVEHLLAESACTLVVVATPPGWGGR